MATDNNKNKNNSSNRYHQCASLSRAALVGVPLAVHHGDAVRLPAAPLESLDWTGSAAGFGLGLHGFAPLGLPPPLPPLSRPLPFLSPPLPRHNAPASGNESEGGGRLRRTSIGLGDGGVPAA